MLSETLNLIFGLLLIVGGVNLPIYAYQRLEKNIRLRIFVASLLMEFGMISIAMGYYLIQHR